MFAKYFFLNRKQGNKGYLILKLLKIKPVYKAAI